MSASADGKLRYQLNSAAKLTTLSAIVGLALVSQTAFFNSDALIAIRGFSAIEFVVAMNNQLAFEQDFPGGSRITTSTSPLTWLHLFANNLGIDSMHFYYVMVTLEIVSFLLGAFVLFEGLLKLEIYSSRKAERRPAWPFLGLSTLLVLSNGQMMDLSRFAAPFFHGQFYGFADGLRLAAFGFALTRKWREAALLLGAAFIIHPIKGLVGGVAVLIAFFFLVSKDRAFRSLVELAIFPVISAAWSVLTLSRATVGLDLDEFVAWTRVFQSHWYPLDLGVLTTRQFEYLVPFMAVIVSVLVGTGRLVRDREAQLAISGSIIGLTLLTFVGVAISIWPMSQFLVQVSLVRASELVVQLTLILLVVFSANCLRFGNYFWASFFLFPLVVFFFPTSNFYLLSLFGLVPYLIINWRENRNTSALIPIIAWIVLSIFHTVSLAISGGWDQATLGLVIAVAVLLAMGTGLRLLMDRSPAALSLVLATGCVLGGGFWAYTKVSADSATIMEGRNYLQVQQWAKENSPELSLFMVDPCINYGWRDFSSRASLGTPREWFMTGWIYSGDVEILRQGEEIAGVLGLQLDPTELGPQSSGEVCDLARAAYYSDGFANLEAISDRFGVDYFVFMNDELDKRLLRLPHNWETVFENRVFVVAVPPL